jgi:hypothetical protein
VLRERAEHLPALDVLLMGLSPMLRVNGGKLQATLSEEVRRPITVFNYAGAFQSVAFDERLLRDVIIPLAKPRIVVYGVTPLSMINELLSTEMTAQMWDPQPVFSIYTGSPAARLRAFLTTHVALLEYREVLGELLEPPLGWKQTPFGPEAKRATATGDIELMKVHTPVVSIRPWERVQRKRFANFDKLLKSTFLFSHLADFAKFCRDRDITLILLNNPVHPLFVEVLPDGKDDYDVYLAILRQTATQLGVRLFEPEPSGFGPPDYYNDLVHHDPAGGAWLTDKLAQYLITNQLVGNGVPLPIVTPTATSRQTPTRTPTHRPRKPPPRHQRKR